jgi:hypothetical protein
MERPRRRFMVFWWSSMRIYRPGNGRNRHSVLIDRRDSTVVMNSSRAQITLFPWTVGVCG